MAAISSLLALGGAALGLYQQVQGRKQAREQAAAAQRQANMVAQGNAMAQQNAIESRQVQLQTQEIAQKAADQTEKLDVSTAPDSAERNRRRTVRQQFAFDVGAGAGGTGGVRV